MTIAAAWVFGVVRRLSALSAAAVPAVRWHLLAMTPRPALRPIPVRARGRR